MPSVLVTGASRGIGRSIVKRLADGGWDVIAGVRNEKDGADVVAENPARVSSVILDVTDADQIAALEVSLTFLDVFNGCCPDTGHKQNSIHPWQY